MTIIFHAFIISMAFVVGLTTHHFFNNSPQEKMIDEIIEKIVKDQTGFNIEPVEDALESLEDGLK